MKRLYGCLAATLVACSASTERPALPTIDVSEDQPTMQEPERSDTPVEVEEPLDLRPLPSFVGTSVLRDLNPRPDVVEVKMRATPERIELAEGFALDMYAYNGSVPGPLLEATVGDTVIVHFTNDLLEETTVHWHGLRIPDDMDGNPRIQEPVAPGETFTYRFVVPDAGTFWYHPHVRTNEQIERGLYGPLVVHEPASERPRHDRERFFVLDDILIDGDRIAEPFVSHMEVMHGRSGNALLTNGQLEPIEVTANVGERERWRLVNSANARTMDVQIEGAKFVVYGNDGGRVPPYETRQLKMPVGQRFDIEVIYDEPGTARLQQVVSVRNDLGLVVKEGIDVAVVEVVDSSQPQTVVEWAAAPQWEERPIDREEVLTLDAVEGGPMGVQWRINGMAHSMEPLFEFARGETVRMQIRNTLGPEHPFHLHGQFFQIPNKPGVWDTILVPGQATVEIVALMDNPGEWMMHCHIAEHAELGMMSSFVVTD